MIKIIQRLRPPGTTVLCGLCMSGGLRTIGGEHCIACLGRTMTAWSCPGCGRVEHFLGMQEQKTCTCSYDIPSINHLKERSYSRISFHLGENTNV